MERSESSIPRILLGHLQLLEPHSEFTGQLPKIQSSSGKTYFAKTGSSLEKEQYVGEAESLRAIDSAAPGLAPRVLSFGEGNEDNPFFISEYKELVRLSDETEKILAKRLATELHGHRSSQGFGFHVPTYCGTTRLKNGWLASWEECFSAMIGDLLDELANQGRYRELCSRGEEIREQVIPKLLGPLQIQPVLLHGDLWSGNVGTERATNLPCIFDPSSFYGHNEADLAIARIFGGFSPAFFATYHTHRPKSEPVDQYSHRMGLYELFHYLNHTVLFGGSYAESAKRKMIELLDASQRLD